MKLDLDFIKEILSAIENNQSSQTTVEELLKNLGVTLNDDAAVDKLAGHLKLIRDANFVSCSFESGGFLRIDNSYVVASHAKYEMTMQAYQMLDAMRNDNLMEKIKGYLKEQGISGIKQAPAYLIGIATQYIMKS